MGAHYASAVGIQQTIRNMITLSIDVTLIEKARLKDFTRKNGKQAKFLDLVLIETPNSEYGDFIVKQSISKEEKASGVQLPILGNGKIQGGRTQPAQATHVPDDSGDSAPF